MEAPARSPSLNRGANLGPPARGDGWSDGVVQTRCRQGAEHRASLRIGNPDSRAVRSTLSTPPARQVNSDALSIEPPCAMERSRSAISTRPRGPFSHALEEPMSLCLRRTFHDTRSQQAASARPIFPCDRSLRARLLLSKQRLQAFGHLVTAVVDLAGIDQLISFAPTELDAVLTGRPAKRISGSLTHVVEDRQRRPTTTATRAIRLRTHQRAPGGAQKGSKSTEKPKRRRF
jgi:hypothetical protein